MVAFRRILFLCVMLVVDFYNFALERGGYATGSIFVRYGDDAFPRSTAVGWQCLTFFDGNSPGRFFVYDGPFFVGGYVDQLFLV